MDVLIDNIQGPGAGLLKGDTIRTVISDVTKVDGPLKLDGMNPRFTSKVAWGSAAAADSM